MAKQVEPRADTSGERNGKAEGSLRPVLREAAESPAPRTIIRQSRAQKRFKPAIRVTERIDVLELIGRGPDVDPAEESRTR
jgi:hypothetical protein